MTDFDRTVYWRKRTIEKLDSHMSNVQDILREIDGNFKHVEGSVPEDIQVLSANLISVYSNMKRVIMMMGKPKKEAHEEKNDSKGDKTPKHPQGAEQVPTSSGEKTD